MMQKVKTIAVCVIVLTAFVLSFFVSPWFQFALGVIAGLLFWPWLNETLVKHKANAISKEIEDWLEMRRHNQ